MDLGLGARCLSHQPGGEEALRAAEKCQVSNLACLLGPRRSKRAKDRQGLRKAEVRTQSLARSVSQPARPRWGSFVKSRRKCLRQRDLPTHLARRPFSTDRETEAPLGVETTEAWEGFPPPLLATQKIRLAETKKASRPRARWRGPGAPPLQPRTSLAEGPSNVGSGSRVRGPGGNFGASPPARCSFADRRGGTGFRPGPTELGRRIPSGSYLGSGQPRPGPAQRQALSAPISPSSWEHPKAFSLNLISPLLNTHSDKCGREQLSTHASVSLHASSLEIHLQRLFSQPPL